MSEGEGADQWITIEEDESKNYYTWVVWPFHFYGIRHRPIEIGERVSFVDLGKDFKATNIIKESTGLFLLLIHAQVFVGEHPGYPDQELTH